MKLNEMQEAVVASNKRVVVITAQAGAGSTTALIYKLAEEASNNKNNLGIYIRRTPREVETFLSAFLRHTQGSRYSPKSKILTFKYNNKLVKIKIMAYEELDLSSYIPVVAVDVASHFHDLNDLINTSGKFIVSDYTSEVKEKTSWAYKSGLLKDVNSKPTWENCVDHIKGYTHDNPGLPKTYLEHLHNLTPDAHNKLMSVNF